MTNEEAISLLNDLYKRADFTDQYGDMCDTSPYEEALAIAEEAINARNQDPCTTLII